MEDVKLGHVLAVYPSALKLGDPVLRNILEDNHLEVSTDDPALVIDWLAPHTEDGKPVEEIKL